MILTPRMLQELPIISWGNFLYSYRIIASRHDYENNVMIIFSSKVTAGPTTEGKTLEHSYWTPHAEGNTLQTLWMTLIELWKFSNILGSPYAVKDINKMLQTLKLLAFPIRANFQQVITRFSELKKTFCLLLRRH